MHTAASPCSRGTVARPRPFEARGRPLQQQVLEAAAADAQRGEAHSPAAGSEDRRPSDARRSDGEVIVTAGIATSNPWWSGGAMPRRLSSYVGAVDRVRGKRPDQSHFRCSL